MLPRDCPADYLRQVTAEHLAFKLRTKLERKLGIANETKAKRAVGALLETHGADISFDDAGELVGADAAIEVDLVRLAREVVDEDPFGAL